MRNIRFATAAAAVAVVALAGCGKATETTSQKATEKIIESAISKDGTKAKVELSGATTKISTTDASGKTTQMEMGAAKVAEADVGVPFYPGTQPLEGQSSRISGPDGTMVSVGLHSDDAADKVAAFYRDKLKAQAEGKQFMDMAGGDGTTTLMLADDASKGAIQVHVRKADKGSDIQIVANRATAK